MPTLIAIAYDVTDDRRRNRVAQALKDLGERVLKSGFELWLEEDELRGLLRRIERAIDAEEDAVRVYVLCARCRERVVVLGQGPKPSELRPKPVTVL